MLRPVRTMGFPLEYDNAYLYMPISARYVPAARTCALARPTLERPCLRPTRQPPTVAECVRTMDWNTSMETVTMNCRRLTMICGSVLLVGSLFSVAAIATPQNTQRQDDALKEGLIGGHFSRVQQYR